MLVNLSPFANPWETMKLIHVDTDASASFGATDIAEPGIV